MCLQYLLLFLFNRSLLVITAHKQQAQQQINGPMTSSSDIDDLADIIDRHRPERSQDSDLPAWIQAHVSAQNTTGSTTTWPAIY